MSGLHQAVARAIADERVCMAGAPTPPCHPVSGADCQCYALAAAAIRAYDTEAQRSVEALRDQALANAEAHAEGDDEQLAISWANDAAALGEAMAVLAALAEDTPDP